MKIKLLNDGGYRGFINATFPIIVELQDDDYCSSFSGIDVKISALGGNYCEEEGKETEDYAGDTADGTLYFSYKMCEYEVIK